MEAIVTVTGKDKVGIIAAVAVELAEHKINVLDITQTILQGNFTMAMAVDMSLCSETFGEVRAALDELGKKLELNIRIQRTDIFEAMHTI